MSLTIRQIPTYLCTGCGTCAGICPTNAIKMVRNSKGVYSPMVEKTKCNGCELCIKVCPRYFMDFDGLKKFNKTSDFELGNFINCYIGHSVDKELRWCASSGGIVTSLLIFALENGIIDGALVTRMSERNALEPEVIIARTRDELVTAIGSKYCPVPANVAIKEILDDKGRYAVVGLPCHIHGIRKAEVVNKKLNKKVVLHIGLFCSHNINFLGTEFLLLRMGIQKEDVIKLSYRGKGWPGKLSIVSRKGCEKSARLTDYWDCVFGTFFFTPLCCTLCADASNELSDISVGDPWLPELKNERLGRSLIITRTEAGERLLHFAKSKGKVEIININPQKVKQSLAFNLNFKKKNLSTRVSFLRVLGYKGIFVAKNSASNLMSYLTTSLLYFNIYVSSKKRFVFLFRYMPFPLLRVYFRFICIGVEAC